MVKHAPFYIKNKMSQAKRIEKFQEGTGKSGITQTNKLKFKVDGEDFELDEKSLTDQFDPFFQDLKQKGYAKEEDKSSWLNTYKTYVNQAKGGLYDLKSSGDKMLTFGYQGDAGALLGLDEEGNSISNRKLKDDNDRISYLNKGMGDFIVSAFGKNKAEAKTKEEQAKAKELDTYNNNQSLGFDTYSSGVGKSLYQADYAASPKTVLDDWWNKTDDSGRLAKLKQNFTDKMKRLNSLEFTDDAMFTKKYGRGLGKLREESRKYFDVDSGSLLGNYKTAGDYMALSNFFDTMGDDAGFYDKSIADGLTGKTDADGAGAVVAGNPVLKETGAGTFLNPTDNKIYSDKNGANPLTGLQGDKFYKDGSLFTGQYIDPNDYESGKFNGEYINGVQVDHNKFNEFRNELNKDKTKNLNLLQTIERQLVQGDAYHQRGTSYKLPNSYIGIDKIQDTTRESFLFKDEVGKVESVLGTNNIYNLGKNAITAQVIFKDDYDKFGRPNVYDKIRFVDPTTAKQESHIGKIKQDYATKKFYMVDKSGNRIKSASLQAQLNKIKFNQNGGPDDKFQLSFTPAESQNTIDKKFDRASGKTYTISNKMKDGGKIGKYVIGGIMSATNKPVQRIQANARDMKSALMSSNYDLSGLDKAELTGLGLDLASFATSLTGAGSVVSGGLGLAGTLTQLGTDIYRDGADLGDAGRFGMNLALDAASFIPGVGVASSAGKFAKTLKNLSKTALKGIQMGMVGTGASKAALLLYDVATTDKSLMDLTIDEQRTLVNGLQAIVGGSRMAGQRMATKKGENVNLIQTKQGPKSLTDQQASTINSATDKVAAAKKILGNNIELITGKNTQFKATINPLKMFSRPLKEKVDITTSSGNRVLKTKDDFGDSRYMNWLSDKVALRTPSLRVEGQTGKRMGAVGDYFRTTKKASTKPEKAPTPLFAKPVLALPPSSVKPGQKLLDEGTKPLQPKSDTIVDNTTTPTTGVGTKTLVNQKGKGTKSSISKRINKLNKNKKAGEQTVMFQKGGRINPLLMSNLGVEQLTKIDSTNPLVPNIKPIMLPKKVGGFNLNDGRPVVNFSGDYMSTVNDPTMKSTIAIQNTMQDPKQIQIRKNLIDNATIPQDAYGKDGRFYKNALSKDGIVGTQTTDKPAGPLGTLKGLGKGIDKLAASEIARALYTRKINSMVDTKVERPMMNAMQQVPVSVRGNFLAKNAYDTQANNLIASANRPATNDAAVNAAMNLQANTNAAGIRLQGEMMNNQALEQSRAQSLENDMNNAANRTDVANKNTQTLTAATQAERGAKNEKMLQMNRPITDYWQQANYEKKVDKQNDKQVNAAIANLDLQEKLGNDSVALQTEYNNVTDKLDIEKKRPIRNEGLIATLEADANRLLNKSNSMNINARRDALKASLVSSKQEGGKVSQREKLNTQLGKENIKIGNQYSKDLAKANRDNIEDTSKANAKASSDAMKNIQEMIKLALSR